MRLLVLSLPLLLTPLAAPLVFSGPAVAAVLPPCCVSDDDGRRKTPPLVGARVRSPDERALEATAEAPITADVPVVNAIGIPLYPLEEDRRGVSEPERVPAIAEAEIQGEEIDLPPCCQAAETQPNKPPHPHEKDAPPDLIAAKVKNREQQRLLTMAAEAQVEDSIQLLNAIGIPLHPVEKDRRGVSEPARVPAIAANLNGNRPDDLPDCCTAARARQRPPVSADAPWSWLNALRANAEVIVAIFLSLLAIGFWPRAPRRRREVLEDRPAPPSRPLPDELPWPDAAPVPQLEPEVVQAIAQKRELEPA